MNKPIAYVAHFTDGSSDTLVRVKDCGVFFCGLAMRADGFYRCFFFNEKGSLHDHDDWLVTPLMLEVVR